MKKGKGKEKNTKASLFECRKGNGVESWRRRSRRERKKYEGETKKERRKRKEGEVKASLFGYRKGSTVES